MNIAIQGYRGSYHEMASLAYFNSEMDHYFADTFDELALQLTSAAVDKAVMAIENSIVGTILSNYRLINANNFWIEGEKYIHIDHCLMGNKTAKLDNIKRILSHPMALMQCKPFLYTNFPNAKLIETNDTALSAKELYMSQDKEELVIASSHAANIYHLNIYHKGIQSHPENYTRFFILNSQKSFNKHANKATISIQVSHEAGALLKLLEIIYNHNINMSKLQSYPVLGKPGEYYFYLDLEFKEISIYNNFISDITQRHYSFKELGTYIKDNIFKVKKST